MKKEFIVERNGKSFVLYAGLLDAAHGDGLKSITTTLVQVPNAEHNGNMAIVHALVETAKGAFTGLGDAAPDSVSRMMVPHLIRMAETRAKARALRDAVNVGVTSLEELGDGEGEGGAGERDVNQLPAETREHAERVAGRPSRANAPATPVQVDTIQRLAKQLGKNVTGLESLTYGRAGEVIKQLSEQARAQIGSGGAAKATGARNGR